MMSINAVASSSTAPIYITSGRKHASAYVAPPLDFSNSSSYSPWSAPELSVQYDGRGRLQPFVETSEQRRARLEFLRKREFSRRISAWLEDSSKTDMEQGSEGRSGSQKSSDTDSLHTIDEDDEMEPEIIYSTSPSPSRWAAPSTSPTTSRAQSRHLRSTSRTSSYSSLSSISEEEVPYA